MVTLKESSLTLPPTKINKESPFTFEGVNPNNFSVHVQPKAGCGCTTVDDAFVVEPLAEFTVSGVLKGRAKPGLHTKSVTFYCMKVGDETVERVVGSFSVEVS